MTTRQIKGVRASERGFTLIELLVVIVIIGILATGAIAVFTGTQQKARTAVRRGDAKTIVNAIELYKADNTNGSLDGTAPTAANLTTSGANAVVPSFLQEFPTDPGQFTYQYSRDDAAGTTVRTDNYNIYAVNENVAVTQTSGLPQAAADLIRFGSGDEAELANCVDGRTAGGAPACPAGYKEFGDRNTAD